MVDLRKKSLMFKMLILAGIVGLVIWAVTDSFQNYTLKRIFNKQLSERFNWQAEKQRVMFDRYVKGHHQAVKLFVASNDLIKHISSSAWLNNSKLKIYQQPPPWLSKLSVIRNFIQPRYILLIDENGLSRELYNATSEPAPIELIKPSSTILNLSHGQGFLTRLSEKPFLIASEVLADKNGNTLATLMIASPLDEEFLIASQDSFLPDSNVIALLDEDHPSIMVSSNSTLIPAGTKIKSLNKNYLITGQGFFDYGATDLIIELVSFVSTDEIHQLTNHVLNEERPVKMLTAVIYIVSFIILMFLITRRLQTFTKHVVGFSERMNLQNPNQKDSGDEITVLEQNFQRLAEAVQNETQMLEHQALHDPLTDLPNRKLLHNRLQQELLRGERTSKQLVLIMTDLNHFKEINDTLGHHIGDLVLQQSAERLFKIFRKTDTVARLGGDEFAILLPETHLEQAKYLIQKVLKDFTKPFVVENQSLSVDISIGLAEFPTHGNDVNILIQRADVAMYIAKKNNLGYSIYDSSKDTHSIGRLALMSELRETINSEALELYFHPKIKVSTNEVIGAEALLRWNHPQRGFIQPSEFIPLAEQTGLIKPLTQWVIERAIKQCADWSSKNINLVISINLSIHNLHDPSCIKFIHETLSKYQISAKQFMLEVTEGDIMSEPIRARDTLNKIKATGIKLSIDDYGTGYSSLSYIKKLPIDELKVDRSFVMEMTEDDDDDVIVLATIELAHNLGVEVVAEGVHDKRTWDRLEELNCDLAQGHYISEPLPPSAFTVWLMNKNKTKESQAS